MKSIWTDTVNIPEREALKGNKKADVAVNGGYTYRVLFAETGEKSHRVRGRSDCRRTDQEHHSKDYKPAWLVLQQTGRYIWRKVCRSIREGKSGSNRAVCKIGGRGRNGLSL